MDGVKEKDEALKSNSCSKEDMSQIGLTPETVLTALKDEGNTKVGDQINEGHEKEKSLTDGEAHKVQAVVEVAVEGKDKEKVEGLINGESSGGGLKRKRLRPRRRNVKRKVAQKAYEMVVGNAVAAVVNNGLSIDEELDKEKVLSEDAVKGVAVKGKGEGRSDERKSMDKLGESINGKGRKVRRIRRRKSAQKASEVIIVTGNGAVKEALVKVETEEKKNIDKLGESSNGKGRKPKRNRQKKIAQKASEMADGDKSEPSNKKSALKRAESTGMVFMCNSKTKADCFRYKILGLPAGKKDQVEKIYKGMRLFLFDVDLRLMYGIFKAVGEGGYNIEPKAFGSAYPSQVRFTMMEDCLPLAEEKFKNVIQENYYARNKFECQLNAQQVKKLCKLFVHAKSGTTPKKSVKSHQSGNGERHGGRDAYKRQPREEERQPHPRLGREQRRYHDYDNGNAPVRYERAAHRSPVHPVARYLPPLSHNQAPVRSYGRETTYSYGRDPFLDHWSYPALDTGSRHYDEIVSQDQGRYHLYGREPPIYRNNGYPSVDQISEYRHLQAAALPPQYHLVSREYPPVAEPAEYHISGGLQARGCCDVGLVPGYLISAASVPEYGPLQTRYGY
uniref:uncharacterized protein LOC122593275 n=1 Tax=Erigeron canadensis TaxID=72917 RepID=UPI001CB934DC|nr:uncharacterized protein LOC122593275 [Erigeron canadensis]